MADHDAHDEYEGLPITWPFRFAGLCLIVALVWFCAGFATEDVEEELWGHFEVFQWLLVVGVVFVIGGAAFNLAQARRRKAG